MGRRSKWAVAVVAVVLAGALSAQAGKVELTSDPAVLLPDGAESVQALRAIERFPSGDVTPAVVVVSRDAGRVLQVLAAGRKRIVEVGTAIGYSTLWMALGQTDGGTIVTIARAPPRPRRRGSRTTARRRC